MPSTMTLNYPVPNNPGTLSGFQPYAHNFMATPPEDPLGWVGVEDVPELQFVPVGMPITVTGTHAGFDPGIWTGTVTTSNEFWIGFTPDSTEYLGDNSAAWDQYINFGDCQVLTYRWDEVFVNWNTKVIYIPKSYLIPLSGEFYELDTEAFRLVLKDIEDGEGITYPDTHRHNTEVFVAGTTFARTIEIINGYMIEFENGYYSVRLQGSNNNFFDIDGGILVQNRAQVIPTNSAGLITFGVAKEDFADAVWNHGIDTHNAPNTTGKRLKDIYPTAWGVR